MKPSAAAAVMLKSVIRTRRFLFCLFVLALIGNSVAQDKFPSHSIELIVTFGPGGGADGMARALAPLLDPILGHPVSVSNVAGGSGNVGLVKLLNNPPDGYTMATLSAATVAAWAISEGYAKLDDFTILAIAQGSPSMLFVASDSPFSNLKELLDHAAKNPGKLRVATSGVGTHHDVTLKYLASKGYPMQNVPFSMREAAYTSLLGKRTDVLYEEPGDVREYLASKKYLPLVVLDDQRHKAFPEVPAAKEFGLELSDLPSFRMLVVPIKTPPERVKILAQAINQALATPEWQKYCQTTYSCVPQLTQEEAKARAKRFYETVASYAKIQPAR
ncbi:MAG TPA: tripartite tricarboxylate transporter substrate binding protein [Blastocatellia bacterium]|nr:tripartite tricarboxylate transporter substrate binding protein [Blastocatellia bacterium]